MGGERAIEIAKTSREYVRVAASATATISGDVISLTDLPQLAFVAGDGNPEASDWHAAEWDNGYARLMLGPDDVALSEGGYWVWITFVAGAEQPVERAGRLRVV